ncbi:valine--tRNA ligase [Novosphingobium sp. JCM 18896]|uniref:valine--tRNA ligase n=1 Tax=Novosphingobium sp. JCM 18896 TaxID=2989731 RepID=UPI00222217F1|nr:valine--tRNA ligase [Novosphingobium sp. JCM 18896]MCW1427727.1 valine--tRNA ligase [Novosphingobium sp. JCM 18896]
MTETQLDKTFDPASIEAKWYAHWEDKGLFRPERPNAVPYTIVNPPPNVTGSLHIGHALDNTLQDVVIRYERLRGKDALWVVGTDHAGIATQMVVERQMEAKQDKRTNYSREAFVDKVWEWKRESGGTITGQLRRLGCSMDWSREQFTMDPHFTKAVVKVFVDLYNQGLIYRDKRLVNWDPKLKTAISDLEVETQEIKGGFWHFRYPLADGVTLDDGADHIVVATTRPETMLADMAVAVNAEDPRYKAVIGKDILQPLTGRRFKVVADEHADPELGSGAVKITPGHDFNDFEVGKRAGIKPADMLNMFDAEAKVVQTQDGLVPEKYLGQDRFVVRQMIVEDMKTAGFLVPHVTKTKDGEEIEADFEPRTIQTPFGDRGGVVIEPWLTDQWYVDAETLAQPPLQAVRSGAIEIVPKTWGKTFFNWMENIQPWCVSRQLWWGHRIPAWYGPSLDGDGALQTGDIIRMIAPQGNMQEIGRTRMDTVPFVAETPEEAITLARQFYPSDCTIEITDDPDARSEGKIVRLRRDEDVLDTWFSSALWPFATLGWPEADATLYQRHYPNDLLISGFDILFFWDARMAMQGMHFNEGQVPWKRLYLHGLVRAADGQKMSKSKGNVVDPLGLIDQYGADALRFFMAAMESQGRDVKMDEKRVEGYRNFATKLWNAARFCQSNGIGASTSLAAPQATSAVNKWIIGEVIDTVAELDKAMAELRFDAAANAIYHFVWDQFCDWYIELIKGQFDDETKAVAGWVLDQILVMLHPFMPFVTEELWNKLGDRPYELIVAQWPAPGVAVDAEAKTEVDWLIALIGNLRTAKAELGIAPGARLDAYLPDPSATTRAIIERNPAAVDRLARLNGIQFAAAPAGAAMAIGAGDANIVVPLEGVIDIAAEKTRLEKALAVSQKEAKSLEGRLGNPSFVEKAKPEAVEKARADHAAHAAEAERLAAALARLG